MQWLEPWESIADLDWPAEEKLEFCQAWERQLRREVSPQHPLFEQAAFLIVRNFGTDDALFQLANSRVAEVHLTSSRNTELNPFWPATAIFDAIDDWARESLQRWHQEWNDAL